MTFKTNNTDQSRDYVTPTAGGSGVNSAVDKVNSGQAVIEQRPDQDEAHMIRPRATGGSFSPTYKSSTATDKTRDYINASTAGAATNSHVAKIAAGLVVVEWRPDQEQQTATRPR